MNQMAEISRTSSIPGKMIADNPDVKMEDVAEYHAELHSEIERGK